MEQHFQKFPRTGQPRKVYPNFQKNFTRSLLSIQFLELSVQWFTFQKLNSFQNFWKLFREISVPFVMFSKYSKVLVEWKALYICNVSNGTTYSLAKTQTSKTVIWTITFNCLYCLKGLFTPWSHGSFCDHELSRICVPWNAHKACEGENRKQSRLRNVRLYWRL